MEGVYGISFTLRLINEEFHEYQLANNHPLERSILNHAIHTFLSRKVDHNRFYNNIDNYMKDSGLLNTPYIQICITVELYHIADSVKL